MSDTKPLKTLILGGVRSDEGVSAFPQSVTNEMLKNFTCGGAAISVLAEQLRIKLTVINLGTVNNSDCPAGVINLQLGPGTANFCQQPAMRKDQLSRALDAGRRAAIDAKQDAADLFIGGELGIGNTTSATALGCALLDVAAEQLAGPGTGLDAQGVARKCRVIHQALTLHAKSIKSTLEALCCVGGFEIAALVGSYTQCAQMGLAVLIDGFICSVAALIASRLCSGAGDWFIYAHRSAEPGHALVLEALAANFPTRTCIVTILVPPVIIIYLSGSNGLFLILIVCGVYTFRVQECPF